jgi:hypothetical protein
VTDRVNDLQGHEFIGEQLQRPVSVACRRLAQAQGDQLRFPFAVEFGRRGWLLAFLALQSQLKAFRHQAFAQILDRLHATVERFRNPTVSPSWSIGVCLEQNLRTTNLLRRPLEFFDDLLTDRTLFVRQTNDKLLVHGKPPCGRKFPSNLQNQQPQFIGLRGH